MTGILLNHLPHHTHKLCSLVRCAVRFPKLPVKRTVPFDSTTVQLFFPYVLFHLEENSHWFFHTNGKRSLSTSVLSRLKILRCVSIIRCPALFWSIHSRNNPLLIFDYYLGSITSRCSGNEPTLTSEKTLFRGGKPDPRERRKSSLITTSILYISSTRNIFIIPDDAVDWRKLGLLTLSFYSSLRPQLKFNFYLKCY